MTTNQAMDTSNNREAWALAATRVAVIAAIFSLVVLAVLAVNLHRARMVDPLTATQITALKTQLAKTPLDEGLKDRIREADRRTREEYFRSEAFLHDGLWLLGGGIIVLLLGWKAARGWRNTPWLPEFSANDPRAVNARSRRAVAAVGVLLAGTLLGLAVRGQHELRLPAANIGSASPIRIITLGTPTPTANAAGTALVAGASPTTAAGTAVNVATATGPQSTAGTPNGHGGAAPAPKVVTVGAGGSWASFRGPGGRGVAPAAGLVEKWDGDKGVNIRWKAPITLPGANSPVVWGDYLFLTGADEHQRMIYCLNARTGESRWKQPVAGLSCADTGPLTVSDDTGYAAPTAATDGAHLCAIFANGDLACLDFTGKIRWAKNIGLPNNQYGHASSLLIYKKLLIVQFDQGPSADDGKSALLAFEVATGDPVWSVKRPVPNSWSTPIVITTGGHDELITCGSPLVIAYHPANGKELWRAECLGGDVAPSPIFAGGLVFVVNQGSNLAAIRPGGSGEVTKSRVSWMSQDNLPDIASPVSDGKLVFITAQATVACVDAVTGKSVWQHDYDTPFRASPTLVGDRVYLVDEAGVTHIIAAARAFKEFAANPLGEHVAASPAIANGCIYLRGKHTLFCIGK